MRQSSAKSFGKNFPGKIAVDTSVLVGILLSDDPSHKRCLEAVRSLPAKTKVFTAESCLTETSFLVPAGHDYRKQLLELLIALSVTIVQIDLRVLARILELQDKYHDLPMDFADAALVALCEDLNITCVLTLDRRDFSIYRPRHCDRFTIVPE